MLPCHSCVFSLWVGIKLFSVSIRMLHACQIKQKAHHSWIIHGFSSTITITNFGLRCLCPNFLASWWIIKLNMRLGGEPKNPGHWCPYILASLPNVGSGLQHCQWWFMAFWSKFFWVLMDCWFEYEARRGSKYHGCRRPYILTLLPNVQKLWALVYSI